MWKDLKLPMGICLRLLQCAEAVWEMLKKKNYYVVIMPIFKITMSHLTTLYQGLDQG